MKRPFFGGITLAVVLSTAFVTVPAIQSASATASAPVVSSAASTDTYDSAGNVLTHSNSWGKFVRTPTTCTNGIPSFTFQVGDYPMTVQWSDGNDPGTKTSVGAWKTSAPIKSKYTLVKGATRVIEVFGGTSAGNVYAKWTERRPKC